MPDKNTPFINSLFNFMINLFFQTWVGFCDSSIRSSWWNWGVFRLPQERSWWSACWRRSWWWGWSGSSGAGTSWLGTSSRGCSCKQRSREGGSWRWWGWCWTSDWPWRRGRGSDLGWAGLARLEARVRVDTWCNNITIRNTSVVKSFKKIIG